MQGSHFLSCKKFHDFPWVFPWLFPSFPWLIIHNSVKYIQCNFCLSWYTIKIDSQFFLVIKFSMTFHNSIQNSTTFQAWKAKKQNSMTFQVFQDPYEPWIWRIVSLIAFMVCFTMRNFFWIFYYEFWRYFNRL